jgi:cytoskeletal protein RodZ
MAIFGRKQASVDSVPEEVREYYQTEKRERAGVAWLLALGTLVVTLLLAAGLYFGGRWAYRSLTHKNNVATNQNNKGSQGTSSGSSNNNGKTGTSSASTSTPSSGSAGQNTGTASQQPAAGSSAPSGSSTANSGSSAPAGSSTTPAPAANSGATSGATTPTKLTNTGPGNTIAVFVLATVAGTAMYRLVILRRS